MVDLLRYGGQALAYGLFIAVIGYFSTAPAYAPLPTDQALIKLSFSHPGQRLKPCRERTAEELARLAPNMRAPLDCPRERSPVAIEFALDGTVVYREVRPPAGLQRDGVAALYRRLPVAAGRHRLRVRLKDHAALADYNYAREAEVTLAPGQVLVIDFNVRRGGFILRNPVGATT